MSDIQRKWLVGWEVGWNILGRLRGQFSFLASSIGNQLHHYMIKYIIRLSHVLTVGMGLAGTSSVSSLFQLRLMIIWRFAQLPVPHFRIVLIPTCTRQPNCSRTPTCIFAFNAYKLQQHPPKKESTLFSASICYDLFSDFMPLPLLIELALSRASKTK